ncbi:hypothetical protein WDZ92_08660 [Nostoc sp. NIES-2111]
MKQKYTNVKRVYYDIETGQQSSERLTKHQTCFDSLSEFRIYKLLCEYFQSDRFDIVVHPTVRIANTDWRIDFAIEAKLEDWNAQLTLANIINSLHNTNYTTFQRIYVEFKGLQDDNFIRQMKNVAINSPLFGNTVILVSDKSSAFGCWDSVRKRFYCHPIVATSLFEDVLKLQEF